jgi:hypothetical protein
MPRKKVLVVGAGFFSRLLVDDLLRYAECDVIVASRAALPSTRFEAIEADISDPGSLNKALIGVSVAICAAGPYQVMPTSLVDLCLRRRIHYIDLADDRDFVRKVRLLAHGAVETAVCTGWSTVSALSGAMVQIAAQDSATIDSIHIHMAPGNRGARGVATIFSLMNSVGHQFTVFRDGVWRTVTGWSEPRDFLFPQPIGTRRGFLIDVPDHELFPDLFGASTVEFRTSTELRIWSSGLSLLERFRTDWTRWARLIYRTAALLSWIGHSHGGIGVEVADSKKRKVSIVADKTAERMAVMPASIMTSFLLSGMPHRGVVSPVDWITHDQLQTECTKRGFRLTVEEL